ncbi:MAG: 30S ribosomal protein S2 [Candidatus Paceibacterota bacterium]|jgi:small subunit ribosomal protein S2
MTQPTEAGIKAVDKLFEAGAHIAYTRSRRHPSQKANIFGVKNRTEIFDLEKTEATLKKAEDAARALGKSRGQLLVVGTKFEARAIVDKESKAAGLPFVTERWIGGTLTNFTEIKKRIARLEDLTMRREKKQLGMYTKKERLGFDKEIDKLNRFFAGIVNLKGMPAGLYIIDPREEVTAVDEARQMHIPVIALAGSDCDISRVTHVIPANDASRASIGYITKRILTAYLDGLASAPELVTKPLVTHTGATLANPSTSTLASAE